MCFQVWGLGFAILGLRFGVSRIRIIVLWGPYSGPLILGNCHAASISPSLVSLREKTHSFHGECVHI